MSEIMLNVGQYLMKISQKRGDLFLQHPVHVFLIRFVLIVDSCDWENLLTSVQCAIISEKSNNSMKAYVLR